jgi:hypothetical protein
LHSSGLCHKTLHTKAIILAQMNKNESNRLDYASSRKNMNTPTTTRNRVLSPRGVLALLVPPSISAAADRNSNRNNSNSAHHQLHYFNYDPCAPRLDPNLRMRRKKRYQELDVDLEDQYCDNCGQNQMDVNGHFPLPYHPHNGEFTLVFFCEMSCRNSNRISIMLANFMQAIQKDDDYYDVQGGETGVSPIQLICVPNDEIDMSEEQNRKSLMKGKPNILSHLASQTDFWCLGYDHVNRLAMIRLVKRHNLWDNV